VHRIDTIVSGGQTGRTLHIQPASVGRSLMSRGCRLRFCLLVAAQLLLAGCAGRIPSMPEGQPIDIEGLKGLPIRDASGDWSFLVKDVLVDDPTGQIIYLIATVDPSGFDLDPRTAPLLADEIVLVPWKFVRFDPAQGRLLLTVDADVVLSAPRPLRDSGGLSRATWTAVDQYWTSVAQTK
jgi:hypothetical protein